MFIFPLCTLIIRYNVATMLPESSKCYRPMVLKYITDGKLKTNVQITEAVSYLKKLPQGSTVRIVNDTNGQVDIDLFEKATGIGIQVSDTEIQRAISSVIESHKKYLLEQRYAYPINRLLFAIKEGNMKWADGKKVKEYFDQSILDLLGEKTADDMQVRETIQFDCIEIE